MREERYTALFASRVIEVLPSGCHIWVGNINGHGYGMIRDGKRKVRAHRVSWELANGPILDGLMVLHRCDVRCCVNPDHLFLGTQDHNMKDMGRKGRARGGARGERQGSSKLRESDVRRIRGMAGHFPTAEIAEKFGVDPSNVRLIVAGKAWKHVV